MSWLDTENEKNSEKVEYVEVEEDITQPCTTKKSVGQEEIPGRILSKPPRRLKIEANAVQFHKSQLQV